MKTKFGFIDPGAIMGVVVALVVLAVGTFAFFITMSNLNTQISYSTDSQGTIHGAINNTTQTGNNVFNIIGVVMIIGAIMSIVGLVYNYVR